MTDSRARLQSRIILLYESGLYIYCTGADCGILYIVSDITNHGVGQHGAHSISGAVSQHTQSTKWKEKKKRLTCSRFVLGILILLTGSNQPGAQALFSPRHLAMIQGGGSTVEGSNGGELLTFTQRTWGAGIVPICYTRPFVYGYVVEPRMPMRFLVAKRSPKNNGQHDTFQAIPACIITWHWNSATHRNSLDILCRVEVTWYSRYVLQTRLVQTLKAV